MPESVIIVQRRVGGYVKGVKVALEFSFSDHPLSAGFTDSSYTDENGEARIRHSNTGRATVYVDRRPTHKIKVPTRTTIVI